MELDIKVKELIVNVLCVKLSSVNEDSDLVKDLGADSLDLVEVVMAIEEAYSIDIPDEDAEDIKTVNDTIKYVRSKSAVTFTETLQRQKEQLSEKI